MKDLAGFLVLHGMKRSGNHAIVNWIRGQANIRFLNNVIPIAPILSRGDLPPANLNFERYARRLDASTATTLISVEDHCLNVFSYQSVKYLVREILLVRHPDNLFSSRIRKASSIRNPAYPRENGALMSRVVQIYKEHALAFLDPSKNGDYVKIFFDEWFSSSHYRRVLSEKLGLQFSDRNLDQVSKHGGGSSFDGTLFDGSAVKMAVTNRRSQLDQKEFELFEEIFRDEELLKIRASFEQLDPISLIK